MTKREKTDIKEKTQAALRVVSSLYCSGEPFWSTTTITREQLVTMLWRYNGNKYVQADNLSRFNDSASVSWWAAEAVNWAVAAGIINGSNGALNPQGSATRAEVASILSRFCQFAG